MKATASMLRAGMRSLIHALNTTDLCITWNLSSVKYEQATQDKDFLAIADVRGFLMDELEARDPAAFAAWLDAPRGEDPTDYYKCTEPSKFKPMTA